MIRLPIRRPYSIHAVLSSQQYHKMSFLLLMASKKCALPGYTTIIPYRNLRLELRLNLDLNPPNNKIK